MEKSDKSLLIDKDISASDKSMVSIRKIQAKEKTKGSKWFNQDFKKGFLSPPLSVSH